MIAWNETGFYKGFIPLTISQDGKKPLHAFKNPENLEPLEAMENRKSFAGVLKEGAVLLDADDEANSEALLKIIQGEQLSCMVSQRENGRGIHALFMDEAKEIDKNSTHIMLACGITVDIKAGVKNSYEALKVKGDERYILLDSKDYQPIPKYLIPISSKNNDFLNMAKGDGRNQALFNYILTLQSEGFSQDEADEAIRILNKYVLKEPLDERELNTILRDEAFKKPNFVVKGKFLHEKFGDYLIKQHHIKRINDRLHIYRDGIYTSEIRAITNAMISEIQSITQAKRKEVLSYIDGMILENTAANQLNYIAFGNGIYNLQDKSFSDYSPNVVVTSKIPWNYNPAAYSELEDKTLNNICCQDAAMRKLLEEIMGYCLYRTARYGKAFILTGESGHGKSTYITIIRTMLGENNVSTLEFKNLGDRFSKAELLGKLANLGDDVDFDSLKDVSIFKKLVTGEAIEAEKKGQDLFTFSSYATLIFSSNHEPKFGKSSDAQALARRLIIIPFEAQFSKEETPGFIDDIAEAKLNEPEHIEYSIKVALEGLHRIMNQGGFTELKSTKALAEEFILSNDPIEAFIKECQEHNFSGKADDGNFSWDYAIEREPIAKVFFNFQKFCNANNMGFENITLVLFSKRLRKRLNLKTDTRGGSKVFLKDE